MTQVHTQRAEVSAVPTTTDMTESPVTSAPDGVVSPTVTVTVRYFAAARAASGVDEERLVVAAPATVQSVLAAAVVAHGDDLERVLERCSYLRNTVAVHGLSTPLRDGDALDVLPPFAGG